MRRLALTLVPLALANCSSVGRAEPEAGDTVPAPSSCRGVASGDDLAAAVAAAHDGDALCLRPGSYAGPVTLDRRITLWGPQDAVIAAHGGGSVVTVASPGARVEGFSLDGTGGRFDSFDAAVHVVADDVVVDGLTIAHSVYGILVEKAARATVRGNTVRGDAKTAMGLRGDTIRLWETYDSVVEDNLVEDGRDMVVWYSSRNQILRNRAVRGRYGTHLMYSHDNLIEGNQYLDGVVGVFIMYSRHVTLRRNVVAGAAGASGMAFGLKDSGDITLEDNVLVRDGVGLYVDNTPGQVGDTLEVHGNVIRQCDLAISFHTTPRATSITNNDFADNLAQVHAEGSIDAGAATWRGNYWDDYTGYDLDDDDAGDLPYRARSAAEALVGKHPSLAFFRGTPVLGMVDAGSRLLPMWQPAIVLVDPAPRMAPRDPEEVLRGR